MKFCNKKSTFLLKNIIKELIIPFALFSFFALGLIFKHYLSINLLLGYTIGIIFVTSGLITSERKPNELNFPIHKLANKILYSITLYGSLSSVFFVLLFNFTNFFLKSSHINLAITFDTMIIVAVCSNSYLKWALKNTPTGISFKKIILSKNSISILSSFFIAWLIILILLIAFFKNAVIQINNFSKFPVFLFISSCFYVLINLIFTIKISPKIIRSKNCSDKKKNLLLLGLDSADWRILYPLIKRNIIPNIKKLMKTGAYGPLDCYGKRYSPIVWTTIATGANVDKHGIKNFIKERKDSRETEPYKSYHRQVPALWNIANNYGKKAGIINWMVTYPVEKVNKFMISDFRFIKEGKVKNVVFPENRTKKFFNCLEKNNLYTSPNSLQKIEEKWIQESLKENKTLMCLLDEFFPEKLAEISAIYTHGPDAVQHRFWQYRMPEKFPPQIWRYDPTNIDKYKHFIDDYWMEVDKLVGKAVKKVNKNTTVCIVSDHGSKPRTRPLMYFNLNLLLSKMGYLEFKQDSKEINFNKTTAYWSSTVLWDNFLKISFANKDNYSTHQKIRKQDQT